MKNAQMQLERTHNARERAHKQRVRGLEEQVNTLKEQLAKEMQQKQSFISRTSQKSDEMKTIRTQLSSSLNEVSRNAESVVLERESQKLDETMDSHASFDLGTGMSSSTPYHRRTKSTSPIVGRLSLEKYNNISMTPTTDPGLSPTRQAVPVTSTSKGRIGQSYVSPLRKIRKPTQ